MEDTVVKETTPVSNVTSELEVSHETESTSAKSKND